MTLRLLFEKKNTVWKNIIRSWHKLFITKKKHKLINIYMMTMSIRYRDRNWIYLLTLSREQQNSISYRIKVLILVFYFWKLYGSLCMSSIDYRISFTPFHNRCSFLKWKYNYIDANDVNSTPTTFHAQVLIHTGAPPLCIRIPLNR